MTPKLVGFGPLFKKCDLNTLTFHLNPFRPTFLFKKATTKTLKPLASEGSTVETLERMLQMSEFEVLKAMNRKRIANISHEGEFHLRLKHGGCALLGD